MGYFPFFVNLTGKICVVIGDGKVAERKAASLRMFDGEVSVYAKGEWNEQVLSQAFLVVAATDQREVNRQIALFCREKGIFVNVADSKEESTVLFPAVIRQGPVSIGISTGGSSPLVSSEIRRSIEANLPPDIGATAEFMQKIRSTVTKLPIHEKKKKKIFQTIYEEVRKKHGRLEEGEAAKIIAELLGEQT